MQFEPGEREVFVEICNYVQTERKIPPDIEEKFRLLVTEKFPETEERIAVLNQLDQYQMNIRGIALNIKSWVLGQVSASLFSVSVFLKTNHTSLLVLSTIIKFQL